jgi:hypothetical protein
MTEKVMGHWYVAKRDLTVELASNPYSANTRTIVPKEWCICTVKNDEGVPHVTEAWAAENADQLEEVTMGEAFERRQAAYDAAHDPDRPELTENRTMTTTTLDKGFRSIRELATP